MIDLLLAFAFWPWAFSVLLVIVLSISAWQETAPAAALAVFVYGVAVWIVFSINPFLWVRDNPFLAIFIFMAYGAVGGLWSIFKWDRWMASDKVQDYIKDGLDEYNRYNNNNTKEPCTFVDSIWFPDRAKPARNKDKIVSWIALWPFSVVGYFFGEVIVRFFEKIYNFMAGVYDRITERHLPPGV